MNNKVAITGGSGFIGSRFIESYKEQLDLIEVNLRASDISVIDLKGVQSVVYSVGIAHVKKADNDPEYYIVNEELALKFAAKAKEEGVSQFIYISSTMVYGEGNDTSYSENSLCTPVNAAGKSKQRAEIRLKAMEDSSFKVAIIRPSLVYGGGVKGNLQNFLKLADSKLPLPFKGVKNQRALVSIKTLVDSIYKIISDQMGGTFTISDPEPVSTEELITAMRRYLGRKTRLFTMPSFIMKLFARVKPQLFNKLFGSFSIDCSPSLQKLELPKQNHFEKGIQEMVEHYRTQN